MTQVLLDVAFYGATLCGLIVFTVWRVKNRRLLKVVFVVAVILGAVGALVGWQLRSSPFFALKLAFAFPCMVFMGLAIVAERKAR